jgi:23S rRNA (uracil1939-C5)-methyltransferase
MNDPAMIQRIAARGDGVTSDGRHVPLSAPGDRLLPDGRIEPGPHHAAPPCRHFPRCGGCQLQHVDDAAFGDFLVSRVAGALASQGIFGVEIRTPILSPPRTRRRAALRAERIGRRVVLGFNEGASHRIVDLAECHVLAPALLALVGPLRELLGGLLRDRRGATVHLALADQGVDLLLEKVEPEGLAAAESLTDFARRHRLARLSVDDGYGPQPRWEPEPVAITLGGVPVPLPPAGFLQATPEGEAALVEAVGEAVGGAATIADLFAGLGTFALPLSRTAKLYAAEGARDPAA